MIKYCLDKWNKNYKNLEEVYANDKNWRTCHYADIVDAVVKYILGDEWSTDNITMIDNGDYQGTYLFLIPKETYQPAEYEYLMTYVNYGSCSGCDTLLDIQSWSYYDSFLNEEQVKAYMQLSKDLLTRMIKPYNVGWAQSDEFEEVKFDKPQKDSEPETITEIPF